MTARLTSRPGRALLAAAAGALLLLVPASASADVSSPGGAVADGLSSARVLSADGVDTLLAPGPGAHLGPWAQGRASQYAMGWFRGGPWGEATFHPGNTPDTSTRLVLSPNRDVAAATVVNAGNEIPVPGNPFIADRVTRNVVHAALDYGWVGAWARAADLALVIAALAVLLALTAALRLSALIRSRRGARQPVGPPARDLLPDRPVVPA